MKVEDEVRAIRKALGESRATFGERWQKSGRTIENWEQGRRVPDAFMIERLRQLAARRDKKRK